ncbi:MAG: permease [Candidatus Anstonellaceae archaeon]
MGVENQISQYIVYEVLKLEHSPLSAAIDFFIYDTLKVFFLLFVISFLVGIIRTYINQNKIKSFLSNKKYGIGNILAALAGIPTPFCTCSAIPLFIGLIRAGVPLGVSLSFLIASPTINEIAIIMLLGLFGLEVTIIYILSGLLISILVGIFIGKLNMEDQLADFIKNQQQPKQTQNLEEKISFSKRLGLGYRESMEIIKQVWKYILIGIAIGGFIHGYIPQDFILKYASKDNPFAVIIAVFVGIPLYSNAAGAIPIIQSLISKGMAWGTALCLLMSITALSFPQILILKKLLKPKLLVIFLSTLAISFIIIGYLFNILV